MVRDKVLFIDSDGTVIDSMNYKHIHCFGPAVVSIFGLEQYQDLVLREWNRINLYSLTRGINRYDGLYQILYFVNNYFTKIDILPEFKCWLETTDQKSDAKLEQYIKQHQQYGLQKVIDWSQESNHLITVHQSEVKPFDTIKKAFEILSKEFILIVISSANKEAVIHEWTQYDLIKYVDEICTQEIGSKEMCIAKLIDKIRPSDALMIGDAMSDLEAAQVNDISFYPVIPTEENASWIAFLDQYKDLFNHGNYGVLQNKKMIEFKQRLARGN